MNNFLDERERQFAIGTIHAPIQWTANTTLNLAKYCGGIHGPEDFDFNTLYNASLTTNLNWQESSERWLQKSLNADTSSPYYNFAFSKTYSLTDTAATAFVPLKLPFKAVATVGRTFKASRLLPEKRVALKTTEMVRRVFKTPASQRSSNSIVDFFVNESGYAIPTNRKALENSLRGLKTFETRSPGKGYIFPNGNRVRLMEPSGPAPLRASFTNRYDQPINPFTGKPVQPPKKLPINERKKYIRERTHIELTR